MFCVVQTSCHWLVDPHNGRIEREGAGTFGLSGSSQRLLQICDQIIGAFDADQTANFRIWSTLRNLKAAGPPREYLWTHLGK
jgi:hypothetical protein